MAPQIMSLNALLHKTVLGFRGPNPDDSNGAAGLAPYMGLTGTSLSHKVSPTYPNTNLSPDELVQVMELTGDHSAFLAIAFRLGYTPIPTPKPGDEGDEVFHALLTNSIKEYGESMQAASTAHQTPSNRCLESYRKEVLESIQANLAILSSLTARADAASPGLKASHREVSK
jgi:hypothetical protein